VQVLYQQQQHRPSAAASKANSITKYGFVSGSLGLDLDF
jgi:hypothetical protein